MQLSGNTVLVTGGASGIGLALVRRFLAAGSRVAICGRRRDALDSVARAHPGVATRVCDLAQAAEREALVEWIVREHPSMNVLVNNAGVQRYPRLDNPAAWAGAEEEIAINLGAPLHLSLLLAPHLARQPRAAVVNVTSGLAFVPMVRAPIYSATKAALRSLTLSLRHQLADTTIEVVELIPPAVDTDLGGPGLHTFGVNVEEFVDSAIAQLEAGAQEASYGFARESSRASREQLDAIFERMNRREPTRPS